MQYVPNAVLFRRVCGRRATTGAPPAGIYGSRRGVFFRGRGRNSRASGRRKAERVRRMWMDDYRKDGRLCDFSPLFYDEYLAYVARTEGRADA